MKREYKGRNNRNPLLRRESGQILVFAALSLIVLCGMAALAIDIGHALVVRHELQNAADASALAGAGNLFPVGPDWIRAEGSASSSIPWNKSDGQSLSDGQVQSGYWNLDQIPPGLQPQSIIPGPRDVPAVKVTVHRADGNNGGPMPTSFTKVLGISNIPLKAQAVAVVSSPGIVKPGTLFPVAISKALAEQYGSYKDPSSPVIIGSPYHYGDSLAGQWTTFMDDFNDVTQLRDLIPDGNPQQVNINTSGNCPIPNPNNDCIWIQPGTENTLYDNPNSESVSKYVDQVVVLPVVGDVLLEATHEMAPVIGFVGFHIISATGGSTKQIVGYFVDDFTVQGSGGAGPHYGALTPLYLVQ
jgi:hypothetical protein